MTWKNVKNRRYFPFNEEGETLVGIWGGTTKGEWGDNSIGVLETEDNGRKLFSVSSIALADRLADITKGTKIQIVYNGERLSKRGHTYKSFDVFIEE